MNVRCATSLFAAPLLSLSAITRADTPDPFREEPFATFVEKLKDFSAAPTGNALRDLEVLCLSLPVRDLKPGQVGAGHPLDRETKLRCLLRFVVTMDPLLIDHLPTVYINLAVPGVPIAGMSPGDVQDPVVRANYLAALKANAAAIEIANFQTQLRRTRDVLVRREIPRFMQYDCRLVPSAHLQQIVAEELQKDPRAQDAVASLSQAAAAR